MKIIGTGLSGLVGSRVVELLSPGHEFTNLSKETGVDITAPGVVEDTIGKSKAEWVFHFAAFTDVDGAEKYRGDGENSPIWQINVAATEKLAAVCRKTRKHLLYISTDFVFDGTSGPYGETDQPNPVGWYATTKYEGEKRVVSIDDFGLIVRIAFPYRAYPRVYNLKRDFVQKILVTLEKQENVIAPGDQTFTPTFVDDIAGGIGKLLDISASGIYHLGGESRLSPYEAAKTVAGVFGFSPDLVRATTAEKYYQGRAPRPLHVSLKHDKISELGVSMHGFREGLEIVKKQSKL